MKADNGHKSGPELRAIDTAETNIVNPSSTPFALQRLSQPILAYKHEMDYVVNSASMVSRTFRSRLASYGFAATSDVTEDIASDTCYHFSSPP